MRSWRPALALALVLVWLPTETAHAQVVLEQPRARGHKKKVADDAAAKARAAAAAAKQQPSTSSTCWS